MRVTEPFLRSGTRPDLCRPSVRTLAVPSWDSRAIHPRQSATHHRAVPTGSVAGGSPPQQLRRPPRPRRQPAQRLGAGAPPPRASALSAVLRETRRRDPRVGEMRGVIFGPLGVEEQGGKPVRRRGGIRPGIVESARQLASPPVQQTLAICGNATAPFHDPYLLVVAACDPGRDVNHPEFMGSRQVVHEFTVFTSRQRDWPPPAAAVHPVPAGMTKHLVNHRRRRYLRRGKARIWSARQQVGHRPRRPRPGGPQRPVLDLFHPPHTRNHIGARYHRFGTA